MIITCVGNDGGGYGFGGGGGGHRDSSNGVDGNVNAGANGNDVYNDTGCCCCGGGGGVFSSKKEIG